MRLQRQLSLLLILVAAVPVVVSGGTAALLSAQALQSVAQERLLAHARAAAEHADGQVTAALLDLRLGVAALPLEGLTAEEQQGALRLVFRQLERANVVALISAEGDGLGDPVYVGAAAEDASMRGHEPMTEALLVEFSQHVPLAAALQAGAALGPPYRSAGRKHPAVAMAVGVELGHGKRGAVAVEVSLQPVWQRLNEVARQADGVALVVDGNGRPFGGINAGAPEGVDPAALPDTVRDALLAASTARGTMVLEWGATPMLLAHAPLDRLPWTVVVAQEEAAALAPVYRMLMQTGFWLVVALLCALLAGSVMARGISRPVEQLVAAANAFEQGRLDLRVGPLGVPDLQRLGTAFNSMAAEVARRDEELRDFNTLLQKRVEERTKDLKDAQDQLIQSQKMAAVGELGAGVAHEINNPLAGLLGTIQLMLLRGRDGDPLSVQLKDMEKEGLRIRDIVQNLMALTPQKGSGETVVDLNRVVEAALNLVARPIVAQRIEVRKELDAALPKIRGRPADLQQAVLAMLLNARAAMPDGGTLTLTTVAVDGKLVKLTIGDTGKGIPKDIQDRIFEPFFTTRPTSDAKGLGLALVHRVVQDHNGRITVDSAPGAGATFTITLTATRERAHLV